MHYHASAVSQKVQTRELPRRQGDDPAPSGCPHSLETEPPLVTWFQGWRLEAFVFFHPEASSEQVRAGTRARRRADEGKQRGCS